MPEDNKAPDPVRFGPFELSVETGELRKSGVRLKLSGQPIQVLTVLVAAPGKLVTREELQRRLWPGNSFGDFEKGLNAAVNRLRDHLNDSATDPKYIETIPGRGYRFIGKVEGPNDAIGPGKTVSHYRILEIIGRGGMGVVYRAQDLRLGRHVALKFLPEELATQHEALARFRREASTASSLNHPNICTIYEIEEHQGQPFIVMELLQGQTLREWLTSSTLRRSYLEPWLVIAQLVKIASEILDGLQAAHEKGIIHRDIKPANIFVTNDGLIKILDFGLAKLTGTVSRKELETGSATAPRNMGELPTRFSEVGVVIGTFGYMAPEQARGEDVDARADLFSLALVLYEMTTGRPAFDGTTAAELRHAILTKTPVPIHELNPSIPPMLEQLINKALDKNRELRYQSASEFRTALMQLKRDWADLTTPVQKAPQVEPQSYTLIAYVPQESAVERAAEVVVWVRHAVPGVPLHAHQRKLPPPPLGGCFWERAFVLEVRLDEGGNRLWTDIILRLDSPNFEPLTQEKKSSVPPDGDSSPCTFLIKPGLPGELVANLELLDTNEKVVASRSIRTAALHLGNDDFRSGDSISFGVLKQIYEDLRQKSDSSPEAEIICKLSALDIPRFTTANLDAKEKWEALQGQVAFGRYALNELVGHGGTGAVFRSRDLAVGREVAVKIFYAVPPSDVVNLRESTTRSVRALASLSHPNLQKALDYGIHVNSGGDASLFVVSEFVNGKTLEDALRSHRLPGCEEAQNPREVETVAADPRRLLTKILLARQVAGGLSAAHSVTFVGVTGFQEHGICHGDLTPKNVLIEETGHAVIIDFMMPDVQRLILSQAGKTPPVRDETFGWKFSNGRYFYLCPPSALYGTPGFMPPEQEVEGIVTPASDIYTLGLTLALLLFADLYRPVHCPDPLISNWLWREVHFSEIVSQLPSSTLRDSYTDLKGLVESMTQPQPNERLQDIQAVDDRLAQTEQQCRSAISHPESKGSNMLRWWSKIARRWNS